MKKVWTLLTFSLFSALIFFILSFPENEDIKLKEDIEAVILARGGSKGIKHKNLALLNNYTLLGRAIKTIKETNSFKRIWVSTDSQLIANEAIKSGALVHKRETYTATDDASSLDALKEFLQHHQRIEVAALVQCTSPFMKSSDLLKAVNMMKSGLYNSVFSTTRQFKLRWKTNGGELESANFDIRKRPRRQDWEGEVIENGMFYLTKRDNVIKHNLLQAPRFGMVEVPLERSMEIDIPYDLQLAQIMILQEEAENH